MKLILSTYLIFYFLCDNLDFKKNRVKLLFNQIFIFLGSWFSWISTKIFRNQRSRVRAQVPIGIRSRQGLCNGFTSGSMTSLLTHTVAHSTRPSSRPKTNNQPLKKFLSLALSCVKVVKTGKILIFKVNFLCQKLSESF